MNLNTSAPRLPELSRLKSPGKDFSLNINQNASQEYFNFITSGKNLAPNQSTTRFSNPLSPKYGVSSFKHIIVPDKTPCAQSSLKHLLSPSTDRVKRTKTGRKDTNDRTDRTLEISTSIFDSSFSNLLSILSPSNKTIISPSNKVCLHDLSQSASTQTLAQNTLSDSRRKLVKIPSTQEFSATIKCDQRQTSLESEKSKQGTQGSCFNKSLLKRSAELGSFLDTLQKPNNSHRPARLRFTLKANKSMNNLSLSKSSIEESGQKESLKSVPSIKELYHESILTKFDDFFGKTQINSATDKNDLNPSLLKINEEYQTERPLNCVEKESILESSGRQKEKVLTNSNRINDFSPKKAQHFRRKPFKFGKKGVIDHDLNQTIAKRLSLNTNQESMPQQAQTKVHEIVTKSPRKIIRKPPKVASPKKRIWNRCFDKENRQIEILENNSKAKLILPPQNPLTSSASFQCFQKNDAIKREKRDFKKVRVAFIEAVKYIKLLKLTPKDLNRKIFSSNPYENKNSREFIHAAKLGVISTLEQFLEDNKYLVYDFDNLHQTALHWAAKRGQQKVVELLVKFGADVNAMDLLGRTPLYFAIHANNIETMQSLLQSQCNPWSTSKVNYNEIVGNNFLAKYYLSKARQIHILMAMTPLNQRQKIWEKKSTSLTREPIILSATSPKENT